MAKDAVFFMKDDRKDIACNVPTAYNKKNEEEEEEEDLGKRPLSKLTRDMAKNIVFLMKDNRKDIACNVPTIQSQTTKQTNKNRCIPIVKLSEKETTITPIQAGIL